ncbi:conserved protein, unknown function [Hepatocystis sp. ex Piliocolobus tephrosceles]|nr:conserved protein, unknown function [Hepatocystis sp. ex Piliocolobus tephrosceles]
MIKRYLKIYPSIYFTKHIYNAPEINENLEFLKKDYVFNQYGNKKVFLNNKLKKNNNENEIKRVYYFKLWNALTEYNFTLFENTIQQFLNEGHKYDEVIYSILVHSYILNHKKKNENAYLVIEEMKRCYMHPAVININQRMINSFLELEIIFCEPSKSLWINICRFIWETSIKLNRSRKRKLKEKLNLLTPNEVLKLTKEDLKLMLKKEYEEAIINMIDTISLDDESPYYEHMRIENYEDKHGTYEYLKDSHNEINHIEGNKIEQTLPFPSLDFAQTNEKNILNCENAKILNYDNEQMHLNNVDHVDNVNSVDNDNIYTTLYNVENEYSKNDFFFSFKQNDINYNTSNTKNDAEEEMGEKKHKLHFNTNSKKNNEMFENVVDSDDLDNEGDDNDYESFTDNEDFDIQLLKKYFNMK